MSKDYKKEIESGHKTKYLHTFFPQSSKDASHYEKSESRHHMKKPFLPFGESSKGPAAAQADKMVLQKPGSFWGGIPLGSRNILEDKLEEVRVKDQLQEEARQERLNKEKGWFTDAKESATSLKQDNDPWYTADIWGDDLPVEAVEECILLASNTVSESKETHGKSETYSSVDMILREDENSFLNCLEELSSLESRASNEITKSKIETNSIFTPFKEYKSIVSQEGAIKSANHDQIESRSQQINRLNTHSLGVQKYLKSMKQNDKPQWEPVIQKFKPYPLFPGHKGRTSKENTYNSLSKLSPSQRKLEKPTRSMPSSSSSQAFTTEWLRNQLEKVNGEYNVLKENMQTKDGESKLLREKLRSSQQQLEKIKQEKANEMEALKKSLEAKVKELEKKLESTKTQMLFKTKEAESSFGKCNERRVSFDRHSSVAAIKLNAPKASLDLSFKQFMYGENRPGEVNSQGQTVLVESSDLQGLSTLGEHHDASSSKPSSFEKQPCSAPLRDETNVEDQGDVDMFNDDDDMILNLPCLDNLLSPKAVGHDDSDDEDMMSKDLARYRKLILNAGDHDVESISTITEELKTCFINKKTVGDDFVTGKGPFLSIMLLPEIEDEVAPEMNFVIPPDQPYICRKVLFNDVHEQPAENYKMTRPTLKEVWQIPLQGFIPAKERTTDRRHKFEEVPLDPALADVLMSSDRFFTPLTDCLPLVLQLAEIPYWDWSIFDTVTLKILEHVRKMAVEVYVAVGDPRRRSAMITVRDREEKVINECLDYTEMSQKFSILSSERWKDEVHIDMRRGLGVITQICALDYRLIMHLLDPRILTATRTINPFSRKKESTVIIGRNRQSTFDMDNLATQCPISKEKAPLTKRRKDGSVSEYMDILMKKWGETLQSRSCSKKELDEMLQFESYINNLIPLPEETEDSYRSKVALEYIDGLSETQLHLLNKRVEELLSKGKVQPSKALEETKQGSKKKEDSLTAVVSKENYEIPKISELMEEEGRTDDGKNKPITNIFLKNIDFTSLIKQHEDIKEVPMEEQKLAWEKIVNKTEEEADDIKRAKHECLTKPAESEPVPIYSRLLETPKPHWEVVLDNTFTATDYLEELDAGETVCVSRYEQEFMKKMYSTLEQMKNVVEDSAKSPVEEDDDSSNSVGGSPTAVKRKLVDSDNDNDCAKCEGKSIPYSLRGSPPMKKRDISDEAMKEDLKAGPSNAIQSPVVADIEPFGRGMMKQGVLDEVMVEDMKAGPSNAIQSTVVADLGFLNKDMIIPKSWKKEAFKKADIAPLKNTSRIELSDNAQDILNKEMEMEIDKLFAQSSKITPERKTVNETAENASSEDIPGTEPITPSIQKKEDESLTEANNLERSLIDNKELDIKYNVKVPTLEECMEKFHKKLKTAGLLEILYEIIKVAGELRYSWKFNALMAAFAHLLEVICDSFIIKHLPSSSSTKIATILREILYSRPSPIVVYKINRCLTKAVKLDGFIKTLCHNSDPETFVKFEEDVYFKRGSCMLQTLCLLMDLTVDETCWDAPYELIRWVNFVLMEEKVTARTWFELKNGFRVKRCFCLQALTNLVIKIVHRAVTFYISRLTLLPDDENFTSEFQLKMEEILHAGLEIVGQMVNIDILSFVRSIRTSYQMYEKFLEQLESIHLNNDTFAGFKLTPNNFYLLQKLLSTRRISEKILEETDIKGCRFKKSTHEVKDNPPDLSDFYKNNKSWPSDRFKPEATEENNKEEWTLW